MLNQRPALGGPGFGHGPGPGGPLPGR